MEEQRASNGCMMAVPARLEGGVVWISHEQGACQELMLLGGGERHVETCIEEQLLGLQVVLRSQGP